MCQLHLQNQASGTANTANNTVKVSNQIVKVDNIDIDDVPDNEIYCPNCGDKGHHIDYPSVSNHYCIVPKHDAYMKYSMLIDLLDDIDDCKPTNKLFDKLNNIYSGLLNNIYSSAEYDRNLALFPSLQYEKQILEIVEENSSNKKRKIISGADKDRTNIHHDTNINGNKFQDRRKTISEIHIKGKNLLEDSESDDPYSKHTSHSSREIKVIDRKSNDRYSVSSSNSKNSSNTVAYDRNYNDSSKSNPNTYTNTTSSSTGRIRQVYNIVDEEEMDDYSSSNRKRDFDRYSSGSNGNNNNNSSSAYFNNGNNNSNDNSVYNSGGKSTANKYNNSGNNSNYIPKYPAMSYTNNSQSNTSYNHTSNNNYASNSNSNNNRRLSFPIDKNQSSSRELQYNQSQGPVMKKINLTKINFPF